MSTRAGRRRTEAGASAVEYSLLVLLIAAVVVTAVFAFGTSVTALFDDSCDTMNDSVANSGACEP